MHTPIRFLWVFAVLALGWTTAATAAGPAAPTVIGSHQINRFEAIRQLQQTLKQNPESLADWVILGELAHEVAIDSPAEQAAQYYGMSRDAYRQALKLAPDNPGLRAAVQFAEDEEAGLDRFEQSRRRATQMSLAARRRDLAATQFTPSLRVYGPIGLPATTAAAGPGGTVRTGTTVTTRPAGTTTTGAGGSGTTTANDRGGNAPAEVSSTRNDPSIRVSRAGDETAVTPSETATNLGSGPSGANYGVRQFYSYPTYQTYAPSRGAPVTFQQYSSSYYPPNFDASQANQAVTLQRYSQQGQGLPLPGDPTGRPATTGTTTTTPPSPPR